jgi:prevent-host-death family protein
LTKKIVCLVAHRISRERAVSKSVNLHDAKTNLSQLVDRAAASEEIVIAKAGRPMARLVPLAERTAPRVPGPLKGRLDFPLDEVEGILADEGIIPPPIVAWRMPRGMSGRPYPCACS